MSFPSSPEGGGREPCLHRGLQSLGTGFGWSGVQSLGSVRQGLGCGGPGEGMAWVENTTQNTKQKTQEPSDRFKLLNNFIYPFCTHTQNTFQIQLCTPSVDLSGIF